MSGVEIRPVWWASSMSCRFLSLLLSLAVLTVSSRGMTEETDSSISHLVSCAAGRRFHLHFDARQATVFIDGTMLRLTRRPSDIGMSYQAPGVALIIDGSFVSLVMKDDFTLRDCRLGPAPLP